MEGVSDPQPSAAPEPTFYDEIGGMATFERIVARFYQGVAEDEVLRPMYPADDLADGSAERRLRLFLAQYWGGPTTYSEERGHPRLRMRHAPFTVDEAAQEAWLRMGSDRFDAEDYAGCVPLSEHAANGKDPSFTAIALYKLGWAYFEEDRFDGSADAFRRCWRDDCRTARSPVAAQRAKRSKADHAKRVGVRPDVLAVQA